MEEDAERTKDEVRKLQDARLVGVGFGDLGGLMFGINFWERR